MADVNLTQSAINLLMDRAKDVWVNTNQRAQLPGASRELQANELMAYAWLRASIDLLVKEGLLPADTEVPLNTLP